MASSPIELYSYWRSSSSWRVRIALNIKRIKYTYKEVNLLNGDQLKDDFNTISPLKLVPVLSIDGHHLCESVAIMEYLDETRPEIPLLPKDPHKRATVRQITLMIVADIQPIQNLKVLKKVSDDQTKRTEWAKYWIENGLEGVEKTLVKSSGKYCVGDELTMADCVLVPQIYNAYRNGVDITKFPTITRINDELSKLNPFKEAHADVQPDAPKQPTK